MTVALKIYGATTRRSSADFPELCTFLASSRKNKLLTSSLSQLREMPDTHQSSINNVGPPATKRGSLVCYLKERLSRDLLRKIVRSDSSISWQTRTGDQRILQPRSHNHRIQTRTRFREEYRDFETYMKDLYDHCCRITRYMEQIEETKEHCSKRGPHA